MNPKDPTLDTSPQNQAPKYPDGFENWPMDRKVNLLTGSTEEMRAILLAKAVKWHKNLSGLAGMVAEEMFSPKHLVTELEVDKKSTKESVKITLKKMFTGTSFLTNLAEVLNVNTPSVVGHKLSPRQGFDPSKSTSPIRQIPETIVPKPEVTPATPVPIIEKPFLPKESLVQEVKAGDSIWKLLGKTLDNSEQFKGMSEAQRTYVLSGLTNKMLASPTSYGIQDGGGIEIGAEVNFAEVLKNEEEIKNLLTKAGQTIGKGSAQEISILENNEKIADWVDTNPDKPLNQETVSEILNPKPKIEVPVAPMPKVPDIEIPIIETPPDSSTSEQLANEIAEAKARLSYLDDRPKFRSMSGDVSSLDNVTELAFRNEIDGIYGNQGILGIGKVVGVDSKDWGEIKGLPAKEVLNYFRDPEAPSVLSNHILAQLRISEKHRSLVEQVTGLINQAQQVAKVDFKPFDNGESMEVFIKRLGAFLMKQTK